MLVERDLYTGTFFFLKGMCHSVLIERYNAARGELEGTALCRAFPEMCRAWASVDYSLPL